MELVVADTSWGPLDVPCFVGMHPGQRLFLICILCLLAGYWYAHRRSWAERVGLKARISHYPQQLSGGEQQRVAIARAFASEPAILFADEPTGNLDAATGQKITDLLFDLNREHGTTLILVTHDERLAARCERALHMQAGQLQAEQTV